MIETLYSVGIDPGWKSFGFVIVKKEGDKIERIHCESLNPSLSSKFEIAEHVRNVVASLGNHKVVAQVERYVAYSGVTSADSEHILMMIGHVQYALTLAGNVSNIEMLRAIDWKQELVKTLFKTKGFDNPSTKLDKKFSVAASGCCLGIPKETKSTHEADATCLASLPFVRVAGTGGNDKASKPKTPAKRGTRTRSTSKSAKQAP